MGALSLSRTSVLFYYFFMNDDYLHSSFTSVAMSFNHDSGRFVSTTIYFHDDLSEGSGFAWDPVRGPKANLSLSCSL